MLKVTEDELVRMEQRYDGIISQVRRFDEASLPPCAHCRATNTAAVQVGVVGRLIAICAATTKVTMIPNGPRPGAYRCNVCRAFFG